MLKRKIQTDLKRKIWNCKKEHVKKQTNVKSKQRKHKQRKAKRKQKKETHSDSSSKIQSNDGEIKQTRKVNGNEQKPKYTFNLWTFHNEKK